MSETAWPPDYAGESKRRVINAGKLRDDRDSQIALMAHYKANAFDFINDWCVTFDPRLVGAKIIPFTLFKRQRDFVELLIECLNTRQSCLAEKCRDVGASWICVGFSAWQWLFYEGATIGWGSRKEEYVDEKGNPKAIFPKIRQILDNLPPWMLPDGFNMREHAPYMKIINPANGATITGEAGDNIGRGGRTTIFFKDESAHYERPELIEAALSENTDVQVDISSVNGSANVFYRRRMAGEIWEPGKVIPKGKTRIFIFDWRDHPGKTQEWYDLKRAKFESEGLLHIFAQEIERNYAASVDKIIIRPEWIEAAIDAHIKLAHLGNFESGEKIAGQDVADGGGDKNALTIRYGVVVKFTDHWAGEADQAAYKALPMCQQFRVPEIYYDSIGVGAGFKGGANAMRKEGKIPSSLRVLPWDASASPLNPTKRIIPGDLESRTNEDQYKNLKAQAWWALRTRFWKTYMAVTKGRVYDVADLISIPSDLERRHQLQTELSQPVYKDDNTGKTLVDKKPEGALSPNLADSCVICYHPARPAKGFFEV